MMEVEEVKEVKEVKEVEREEKQGLLERKENQGFLERNIQWLFFMAGIVIAGGRISLVDNYVAQFGEYSTVGYVTVGFIFIVLVKLLVKLSEILFPEKSKVQGEEKVE